MGMVGRRERRFLGSTRPAALMLALCLSVMALVVPPASAQLFAPGGGGNSDLAPAGRPWWHPGRGRRCGRLWCSTVVIPYARGEARRSPIVVAVEGSIDLDPEELEHTAERRSEAISRTFDAVVLQLREGAREDLVAAAVSGERSRQSLWFWWIRYEKPLHPLTPSVVVGRRNNATVVFVAPEPGIGLASRTLATVTAPDATHAGVPVEDLADRWREILRENLSSALWGISFDLRHPWMRPAIKGLILLIALLFLGLLAGLQGGLRRLRARLLLLQRQLHERSQEKAFAQLQVAEGAEPDIPAPEPSRPRMRRGGWVRLLRHLMSLPLVDFVRLRDRLASSGGGAETSWMGALRRLASLVGLVGQMATLLSVSVVVAAAVLVMATTPVLRPFSRLLVNQLVLLPLIWLLVVLAQILCVFLIERRLAVWVRESRLRDPESNRCEIRAQTYAKVLTGAVGPVCVAAGVYLTVLLVGINPAVLAGAGVAAVVVGFLSRGLLEDMLNGGLILITDRYAIGDVVTIGSQGGFVEGMNLHATRLRGLDGQLITIPNGQIRIVENLTKDWSRVNFEVEVSSEADLPQVLELVRREAEAMAEDPRWRERILDTPEILGVDRLHHAGCLIRVWIKTAPMAQWLVGREFRLRIKQALDRAGISLGAPRRTIRLEDRPPSSRFP
jgi:small conductance mechanosensitive channel